ncbi:hypothetical protein G7Y89_g14620 [Cudoniella acicularis]|uniref:Uncharacterized protein n=1 Tax=Cudoniella acicularis TaxID=354080 RepID=A0A8H4VS89_9HELO|nr:hypothetical protein G7Y89_g14620 [Cudoniella acicularis]
MVQSRNLIGFSHPSLAKDFTTLCLVSKASCAEAQKVFIEENEWIIYLPFQAWGLGNLNPFPDKQHHELMMKMWGEEGEGYGFLSWRAYEREKRRHGCGEAVKYPHKDPFFGLDLLIKDMKDHTAGAYLKEIQHHCAVYGKTHEIRFLAEEGELFKISFDYIMDGFGNRVRLGPLKFLYRDPLWLESVRNVHAFVEKHIDPALQVEKESKIDGHAEKDSSNHRYILFHEMAKQT